MNRERVVVFLDYANVNRSAKDNSFEVDFGELLDYLGEGRFVVEAHAFVPVDPRNEHRLDREIESLWSVGYVVHTKVGTIAGDSYKCDYDVEITMEVLRTVYQVKPDIIVLASGDSDFVPLVHEVRRNGVRVEVAAFEQAASWKLRQRASGFISLNVWLANAAQGDGTDYAGAEDVALDEPENQGGGARTGPPMIPNADSF